MGGVRPGGPLPLESTTVNILYTGPFTFIFAARLAKFAYLLKPHTVVEVQWTQGSPYRKWRKVYVSPPQIFYGRRGMLWRTLWGQKMGWL